MFGMDADLGHDRILRQAPGTAGRDPAANELVIIGTDFQPLAAAVRHLRAGLEQNQAVVRRRRENAAATGFLHQGGEIDIRLETQER